MKVRLMATAAINLWRDGWVTFTVSLTDQSADGFAMPAE
jgi:hypothetical protein